MNQKRREQGSFVCLENPWKLSVTSRLIVQQGGFLCPSDPSAPFEDNLKAMTGWNSDKNVVKLVLNFEAKERRYALEQLHRMNISDASLFPGLDGFARSFKQRLEFYSSMAEQNTGRGNRKL